MGLSPFLVLPVEQLQPKDTFTELAHHVDPQQCFDLLGIFGVEAKERVDLRECAEVEATGVCAAFFIGSGDWAEFAIPILSCFVAVLKVFAGDRVGELVGHLAIGTAVNQLTNSMPKQLMASHVHLIASSYVLSKHLRLFSCSKLHSVNSI